MAQVISGNQIKLNNGQVIEGSQGGWYDAQQLWGGTLSAPGVINSLSDQIGAGQAVSKEVNAQSAAAQGVSSTTFENYLQTQRTQLANASSPALTSSKAVKNYTNGLQNGVMAGYTDSNTPGVQSLGDITTELKGLLPTESPTAPKLLDTHKALTSDGTITSLEQNLIDLKSQKADAIAQLTTNVAAERTKPVAQGVAEGRISEQQRIAQEKVDFIDRQIATASDELTMRYKSVEAIMTYMQQDFTNAKSVYDSSFSQAMDMITQARGIQNDQISVQQKAQDTARANLQVFANAITSGNMSLDNASPDVVASLNSMELAAGLPMGFLQSLNVAPKEQILHINDTTGEVLMSDGNGGFKTVKAMSGTSGDTNSYRNIVMDAASTVDAKYQTINGKVQVNPKNEYDANGNLINNLGDQKLSKEEYNMAFNIAWANSGTSGGFKGTKEEFMTVFAKILQDAGYTLWQQ